MYDKIKNPLTGRFVNTKSRLGKSIIKSYINQLGGGVCGVNPKTDRCNKKFSKNNSELCEIGITGRCRKRPLNSLIEKKTVSKVYLVDPLTNEEATNILKNFELVIGNNEQKYSDIYEKIINLKYDANYKSKFTGKIIDITTYSSSDVLWWQASDKVAAHFKYGDDLE